MDRQPTGWIWTPEWTHAHDEAPRIVLFRRELRFDAPPARFMVSVSADSRYKLWVNGESAAVGPCKGDGTVWYHETVDLAPRLRAGVNIIAAEVLRYPVAGMYNHSVWRTETPGFYLRGASEPGGPFFADGDWRCRLRSGVALRAENPGFAPLWISEDAAGDAALPGWKLPGYDDGAWPCAKPLADFGDRNAVSPGNLHPRPIPMLYERGFSFKKVQALREAGGTDAAGWEAFLRGESLTIPARSRAAVEFDAGELTTAYLTLSLIGGKESRIRILCAESYVYPGDNPFVIRKGDRCDSDGGVLQGYADDYAPAGCGTEASPEEYEPFWFRTFRFVRLEAETGDEALTLTALRCRETGYPLEVRTEAAASDPDFAGIWDICLRSLRRCMHETYEDCPFYEQLQYAMDARSQILYTYAVSGDDRMARRTIEDFHRSQRPEGLLNCSYPCYGPNVIPGFSLYYVLMLYDHMMYFGDRDFLRRYLPTADGILGFFDRQLGENGMLRRIGEPSGKYWSFIDWVPQWRRGMPLTPEGGAVTMESFLYLYALQHAAELCDFCGRSDTAAEYSVRAEALKAAIRANARGADGIYQDSPGFESRSRHCQAFAVLTDTAAPSEQKPLMEAALADDSLAGCTVAFAFYLFRALEKAGLYERTRELWEPWRKMLRMNLTTCMEADDKPRSDCHGWGALLLYELPAVILGVRPAAPGWRVVRVSPQPGWLDYAEGSVVTPRGPVRVAWKRSGGGLELQIDAPPGVEISK